MDSLLEVRVLHKEAWAAKLLGTHLHKKFKFCMTRYLVIGNSSSLKFIFIQLMMTNNDQFKILWIL